MDDSLDIQIEETLKAYMASGVEDQVDYQKFHLYSIVPSIVRKDDKGEYIQSLVDSRENNDSTIAQDVMLRHHIANLNRRVLQYQVTLSAK